MRNYSLGMKQRLALAGALLHDPELLLLDEPTNGLDPAGMREFRQLIRELGRGGKTVFVSSHLLNEVEQACDHVAIIKDGRLITQGRVHELVRRGEVMEMQRDRRPARASKCCARCRGSGWSRAKTAASPSRRRASAPRS